MLRCVLFYGESAGDLSSLAMVSEWPLSSDGEEWPAIVSVGLLSPDWEELLAVRRSWCGGSSPGWVEASGQNRIRFISAWPNVPCVVPLWSCLILATPWAGRQHLNTFTPRAASVQGIGA